MIKISSSSESRFGSFDAITQGADGEGFPLRPVPDICTPVWALGMMSGTSMDGVDAALIETDGVSVKALGPDGYREYPKAERVIIERAKVAARSYLGDGELAPDLVHAARVVERAHVILANEIMRDLPDTHRPEFIGFHGQTVIHRPDKRFTLQLGDGEVVARGAGVPVVSRLREADIGAGGEGAPLVPVYHQALVSRAGLRGVTLIVNLGGVANVTCVGDGPGDDNLIAFDTGPGMALLDDWVKKHCDQNFDRDGRIAAAGEVCERRLQSMLGHPFFQLSPPKSLDRDAFSLTDLEDLSLEHGAATLVAFTVDSLIASLDHFPRLPDRCIVCGGGASHPEVVRRIQAQLSNRGVELIRAADLGWSENYMEAQAFGFLAIRSIRGLPITFPRTTGVAHPQTGGMLATGGSVAVARGYVGEARTV